MQAETIQALNKRALKSSFLSAIIILFVCPKCRKDNPVYVRSTISLDACFTAFSIVAGVLILQPITSIIVSTQVFVRMFFS
jgi:hypothetical protein